jgi:hypothetical protein
MSMIDRDLRPDPGPAGTASALLTIDLAAIAENHRLLAGHAGTAICAAVVKADAYGLGADWVAPVLIAASCRHFFVAQVGEGIALRSILGLGTVIAMLSPGRVQLASSRGTDPPARLQQFRMLQQGGISFSRMTPSPLNLPIRSPGPSIDRFKNHPG